MPASTPTPAPADAPVPAPPPITASTPAPAQPWWVPPWPVFLATGLYGMTFWLLWVLSPEKGKDPSDLFKTLAGAIVLTAFVNGVVAAVFTASRDSQRKNETIAAQAKVIASQTPSA
jgi:hypothetical protein